jgi:hypothetical protein
MKKIIRSVKFYLNKHKPIDINFWWYVPWNDCHQEQVGYIR